VLLATGSEPVPFNLPRSLAMAGEKGKMGGGAEVITVEGLLSARRHPSRALVIGGGPGGVEAARILALGGASVTLVERLASLLPGEEEDVGELIRVGLEDLGVRVLTGTDAASLDAGAELIVQAVGRRARTAALGLTKAGSAWSGSLLDERGFVRVDSYLRTPVAGLFAAGDVTGPPFWAHRAMEQGRAAVVNALSGCEGFSRDLAPRLGPPDEHVPRVVFSDPEFGAVGLNRRAAEAAGHRVITGTAPMAASARARAAGKSAGFVRVAADRDTGRLLGAEAVSPAATELAAAGLLALRAGLTLEDLSASAFAHPTYAETLGEAARDAWVKRLSGAG
jgi:dihydrolipoamide dehydrogenase